MKILIDRDELVRVFKSRRAFYCDEKPESFRKLDYSDKCRVDMLDSCIADVFNMPKYEAFYNKNSSSEALENQKTGHWIELNVNKDGTHNIYCSNCNKCQKFKGHANSYNARTKLKYCFNCGAKMEGEQG